MRIRSIHILFYVGFCLVARPALAADPAVSNACRQDAFKYCAAVIRDDTKRQACMIAHGADLSLRCIAAIRDSRGRAAGEAIAFSVAEGSEKIHLNGWLIRPKSTAHFGVAVILHRCDGLSLPGWTQALQWAHWFNARGFGAFIVDSFTGRGLISACGKSDDNLAVQRVQDLAAATARLAHIPGVDASRLVALGISQGGWSAVEAAYDPVAADGVRLKALIALYPYCAIHPDRKIATPLLVLAGSNDDWIPSDPCRKLEVLGAPSVTAPRVKIYPNARHLFDVKQPATTYLGHHLAYNKEADDDAHIQIENFLTETLPTTP